ncbi:auxin-responsive protein SAUR71 [Setaria viridis]|uniref:auxin-responsive protein SAUR71 n=1 Tax=Setaria viridis TaxID=4556 RepID=UPI001493A61F|nr:auxin-responsive protein SAUR71-like [Setaria viridis]
MKRLLRRLSRTVAAAGHGTGSVVAGVVPEGHVPVCVGEEGEPIECFVVRAELLGKLAFAALLRRAAQEYGYAHPGALRIPCLAVEFHHLLLRLSDNNPFLPSCTVAARVLQHHAVV